MTKWNGVYGKQTVFQDIIGENIYGENKNVVSFSLHDSNKNPI